MKLIRNLTFLLFTIPFFGCLEPVDILDDLSESKLVVNSYFTNDLPFYVRVSASRKFGNEEKNTYIDFANVSIWFEGELIEQLTYFPPDEFDTLPSYRSHGLIPEVGKEYEIRVTAENFEPVSSTGSVPPPTKISNTSIEDDGGNQGTNGHVYLSMSIDDPRDEENYYHILLYQLKDELATDLDGRRDFETRFYGPLKMYTFDPNAPVTFYINNRGALVSDRSFNGTTKKLNFRADLEKIRSNDDNAKIIIELRSITEDYYDYFMSIKRQNDQSTNPLSEPVIDFTNIENGFGLFTGFSVSRDTLSLN
ncbi:MAG: DUF4249 domain-containing protein [Saprospiraceae bacterium]